MTDLIPDVGALAEQILDEIRRDPGVVYVEGGVGSGRGELVRRLREIDPTHVRPLEFLQLTDADATSTAFLECAALLPPGDRPMLSTGSATELHRAARKVFQTARDLTMIPVLRVPESWQRAVLDDDAGARRARAILHALTQSGCAAVVVADAALSATALGIDRAFELAPHTVPLHALGGIPWGPYEAAFTSLLRATPGSLRASPFAWRLAVGTVALDAAPRAVLSALRTHPVLPSIAGLLATQIRSSTLDEAVSWLLALRRPIPREEILPGSGIATAHLPLLTECVGYGGGLVRVATAVRTRLSDALSDRRATTAQHDALAARYANLDGVADPTSLAADALQAWCEKVHHAAHGGAASRELWQQQRPPSPELYWDLGKRLSVEDHDYVGAAAIYRRCVERFPDDDYGWQYLAYNLQRASGPRAEVEDAYRRSVSLARENAWWNARLVAFLIDDGQPGAAQREWEAAIDRVDVDGSQLRSTPWLAESFVFWVADAWYRAGRVNRAAEVLRTLPAEVIDRAAGKVRRLATQVSHEDPAAGGEREAWGSFLAQIEGRTGATPTLATQARAVWIALRAMGGAELPEPAADVTADGERFQFAWSYATLYVEVEVDDAGGIVWFARDRVAKKSEGVGEPAMALPQDLRPWLQRVIDG